MNKFYYFRGQVFDVRPHKLADEILTSKSFREFERDYELEQQFTDNYLLAAQEAALD